MNVKIPNIFLPLLTLMFIYLKLTGVILWSWWWVLAPIWVPAAIALVVIGIIGIIVVGD